jgi:hypothetical protein
LSDVGPPPITGADAQDLAAFRSKSLVLEPGARGQSLLLAPLRGRLEMLSGVSGVVLLLCCANVAEDGGADVLLLDSEALSAVAHGPARRRDKVRALIVQMRARELPVAVAATVLAEVIRGRPADAGVFAGVRRERVHVQPIDARAGVRAGQLLGSVSAGKEMAIDAFTVAVADLAGGAVVAATDLDDLERLAARATRVTVADIR